MLQEPRCFGEECFTDIFLQNVSQEICWSPSIVICMGNREVPSGQKSMNHSGMMETNQDSMGNSRQFIDGLSIVIPCFNSITTIVNVLDSIYQQNIACPYEIIIIDDGSMLTVKDLVCNKKNIIYKYQSNTGVSGARNAGVQLSNFSYICFLDSDDVWKEGKIRHQLELMELNNLAFLGTSIDNKVYCKKKGLTKISPSILPLRWWPHISTVIVTKQLFDNVGKFDETMRYAEDGDFLMRIAKSGNLYVTSYDGAARAFHKLSNYESGLSSNLTQMYWGEVKIVMSYIDNIPYRFLLLLFITLKFLVRNVSYMTHKVRRLMV